MDQLKVIARQCNPWAAPAMVTLLFGLAGCGGGPASIAPVDVDVKHIARQILAEHDTDNSNGLSRSELSALPPMEDRFERFDLNGDRVISAEELEKNLVRIFQSGSSLLATTCVVQRNGQPLSGAEVRFVPVAALSDVLPIGSGVSDSDGAAMISAPREELPSAAPTVAGLMPPGLYLVEVVHPSMRIPEKYNRQTVLGKEISTEMVHHGGIVVDLNM